MEKRRTTVFSRTVHAGKRTYFVDIEQTKSNERIVFLIESQGEGKERYRVLIFEEDLPRIVEAMQAALDYLRKQVEPPDRG